MKYLVMVQGTQADYEGMRGNASEQAPAWSEQELQAMYAYMGAIGDDLSESGELVDAQGLTDPARARQVSLDADGKAVITDGPYSETKELMAATGWSTARAWSGSPRSPSGSPVAPAPRARPATRWSSGPSRRGPGTSGAG